MKRGEGGGGRHPQGYFLKMRGGEGMANSSKHVKHCNVTKTMDTIERRTDYLPELHFLIRLIIGGSRV